MREVLTPYEIRNCTSISIPSWHIVNHIIMAANGMIQSGIFEDLQRKIDEDTAIKDVGPPLEPHIFPVLIAPTGSS